MLFEGFDWDAGNREKCRKHGMTLEDIESVFRGPVLLLPDPEPREPRQRAIGVTQDGRKAFIVFTMRRSKIRPLSARFMHRREIEAYEASYPDIHE